MTRKFKSRMETTAVYWEPRIKTYGFHEHIDLTLVEAAFRPHQQNLLASFLQGLDDSDIQFRLILSQSPAAGETRFTFVLDRKWEDRFSRLRDGLDGQADPDRFSIQSPVELVYFFGPHFGERYGIADATFAILTANRISFLAAGFSGSAVYLVLPEDGIEQIRPLLQEAFEVPKSK